MPSATDVLATQQSQTDEQLEALHVECSALCEAAAKAVAEREVVRRKVDTVWVSQPEASSCLAH